MENTAHHESFQARSARLQNNPPNEIISTLLASIEMHFNNEIKITVKDNNYQTVLLFLGIHAVALTISYGVFNDEKVTGYKLFLEKFMDGETEDTKFSTISGHIHNFRNVLAHQWLGASGHAIGFDYQMPEGWKEKEGRIFINPKIYVEHYLNAFSANKLWSIRNLPLAEKEAIKKRLLGKFQKVPEITRGLITKQKDTSGKST
jgi:hypothetical protein